MFMGLQNKREKKIEIEQNVIIQTEKNKSKSATNMGQEDQRCKF